MATFKLRRYVKKSYVRIHLRITSSLSKDVKCTGALVYHHSAYMYHYTSNEFTNLCTIQVLKYEKLMLPQTSRECSDIKINLYTAIN